MPIRIYNTLSRQKEDFVPINADEVRMYACGPTVYNFIHIGNARTFVMADVIRRYLEYAGYKVRFVMNITDIDDKIIKRAQEDGLESSEVAQLYSEAFFEDIAGVGIRMPDAVPRVTEHLEEILEIIQTLILKGFAYESKGSVYYDVGKFPGYGKLSGKNIDDLVSGARVEVDENKSNPLDFALWKASKPGEPAWDSLWGPGRPGWHIECSAMSMCHLGDQIDIHTGGADLMFPHHENEIAQSEGATGHQFVKYWMHFGFLNVNDEKMSKSAGNFWLLRDILKKVRPEALRLFFLQKHYASPLSFSEDTLRDAENAHKRLEATYNRLHQILELRESIGGAVGGDAVATDLEKFGQDLDRLENDIVEAMNDDFNTAAAMGKIFEVFNGLNKIATPKQMNDYAVYVMNRARDLINEWNGFLGFLHLSKPEGVSKKHEQLIELLLSVRKALRDKKEWAMSDRIRDGLAEIGVAIEDSPEGTTWRLK